MTRTSRPSPARTAAASSGRSRRFPGRDAPLTRPAVRPVRLRSRGRPHDGPGQAHSAANAEGGRSRAGAGPPARHVGKPGGSMRSADRETLPTATDPRPRDRDQPDPAVSGQAPGHAFPIDIDAAKGPPQPRSETGQPWEADQSCNGNIPVVPSFLFRDFDAGSLGRRSPSPEFPELSATCGAPFALPESLRNRMVSTPRPALPANRHCSRPQLLPASTRQPIGFWAMARMRQHRPATAPRCGSRRDFTPQSPTRIPAHAWKSPVQDLSSLPAKISQDCLGRERSHRCQGRARGTSCAKPDNGNKSRSTGKERIIEKGAAALRDAALLRSRRLAAPFSPSRSHRTFLTQVPRRQAQAILRGRASPSFRLARTKRASPPTCPDRQGT